MAAAGSLPLTGLTGVAPAAELALALALAEELAEELDLVPGAEIGKSDLGAKTVSRVPAMRATTRQAANKGRTTPSPPSGPYSRSRRWRRRRARSSR